MESSTSVTSRLRLCLDLIKEMLRGLEFQSKEENGKNVDFHSLLPFRVVVTGESRVGKSSFMKALTGIPFDSKEPKTQGFEIRFVDRRWNSLDFNEGLKFGYFSRFVARHRPGNIKETLRFTKFHLMVIGFAFSCSVVRFVNGSADFLMGFDSKDKTERYCPSGRRPTTILHQTPIVFLIVTFLVVGRVFLSVISLLGRLLFLVSNSNISGQAKNTYVRFIIFYTFGSSIVSFICGIILGCGFGPFTNSCDYSCDHLQ